MTDYPLVMLLLPVLATAVRLMAFIREDGEVRSAIWDYVVDQIKAIGVVGLLGPPLGLVPIMLYWAILDGALHQFWLIVPLILPSYVFGGIPALATAAVVGALKPWLWGWRAVAVSSATGAALSSLWVLATFNTGEMGNAMVFAVAGAFGGAVCARIWFGAPSKT